MFSEYAGVYDVERRVIEHNPALAFPQSPAHAPAGLVLSMVHLDPERAFSIELDHNKHVTA